MAEELEDDKLSKVKEAFKPLTDAVNKIGVAKIILFLLVVGIGAWFTSLPKPGSLFVTVTELDSTTEIQGALVSLQWADGQLIGDAFSTVTDSSGVASFTNVPTQQDITIVVEGTGEYDSGRLTVKLASNDNKNEVVKLARVGQVALSPAALSGQVSETCVKEAKVTVTNSDQNAVEAIFIGSGDLQTAVSSTPVTVSPGSSENVSIFIDVSKTPKRKGQVLSGEIHIKGMNKKININLQVSEPPKVDVSPSSLSCGANRPLCTQMVTVKNNGDYTLNNLKVEASSTVASVLENSDVERYYLRDYVAPGEEAKFGARLIGSSNPTIGVITVKADCFVKQIDVQVG